MTVIELPDDLAALKAKAEAQGHGLVDWLKGLASDACGNEKPVTGGVLDEMNALRARLKPDPEGWTTRD